MSAKAGLGSFTCSRFLDKKIGLMFKVFTEMNIQRGAQIPSVHLVDFLKSQHACPSDTQARSRNATGLPEASPLAPSRPRGDRRPGRHQRALCLLGVSRGASPVLALLRLRTCRLHARHSCVSHHGSWRPPFGSTLAGIV